MGSSGVLVRGRRWWFGQSWYRRELVDAGQAGLRRALSLDSALDRKVVKEFLDRSLPPDIKH
jgi:hypothetical protein